jgi:hypothetical protein
VGSRRTAEFVSKRLGDVVHGRIIDASGPPPVDVLCSHVLKVSQFPLDEKECCTDSDTMLGYSGPTDTNPIGSRRGDTSSHPQRPTSLRLARHRERTSAHPPSVPSLDFSALQPLLCRYCCLLGNSSVISSATTLRTPPGFGPDAWRGPRSIAGCDR